ncbi:MAG: lysozyme inhibitor LprI family protein [Rhodocyclaceae bacterium]
MLTQVPKGVLRHTLVTIFLLAVTEVQAGDRCAGTQPNWAETEICTDQHLMSLDEALNNAYSLVRQSVPDKSGLRNTQLKWLRLIRDGCTSKECLERVYQERLTELSELLISAVRPSEKPLSNNEAEETCKALAVLADNERLVSLAIPGKNQWQLDEKSTKAGWSISQEEKAKLEAHESYWSNEPRTVYRLRLTAKGSPTRFASFSTGGTCASYQVFNIPYLLSSKGDDVGVDDVSDPEEEIRWAYWGGGDYPIFYRGHYFMITSDLSNKNRVNMISWIKPDGRQRPLCLLSAKNTKMKVVSAKNPELCSGVANGNLHPLKWKPITEDLPFSHAPQGYRDEFVKRYGDYADGVSLLSIDFDGSGKKKNIGRFEYASGAGCGSTRVWLSILSKDFGAVVNDTLNSQFGKLANGSMDFYKAGGRYYIAATISNADAGVVEFVDGRIEQICEFRHQTKTAISQFFNVEP